MFNIDRLYEAVEARGHVCVGLDTAAEYLPPKERRAASGDAAAVLAFNKALIDATVDTAACYKVQIACYEEMGLEGLRVYSETLKFIRSRKALVIADIKRGDIADTAERYARAHFAGEFEADFVTLSPYMGLDSVEPWLSYAPDRGKGAFVLVRTSNRGMNDFENLAIIEQGEAEGRLGRRLYDVVGEKLARLAREYRGVYGYLAFGAVVGVNGSDPAARSEAARIRKDLSDLFFLVPGYGAQGGAAKDAAALLAGGNGAVVNASRSILRAWMAAARDGGAEDAGNGFAAEAARRAVIEMRDAISAAAKAAAAGGAG
ncbi:MAG: orotidine-5'-phosphate decarboxylase [Treponema sp.]|jgi:orotidine-5'-phosphate decarboxylase|nr:orotidine-5'-phosphate decarboxylase [Treponema sp.]